MGVVQGWAQVGLLLWWRGSGPFGTCNATTVYPPPPHVLSIRHGVKSFCPACHSTVIDGRA